MALKRKAMDADDLMRMQEVSGVELGDISESESGAESDDVAEDLVERDTGSKSEPSAITLKLPVKDRTIHIRTIPSSIPHHSKRATFKSLGTSPSMISALTAMSIKLPTEVQIACIPPLLAGTQFPSISK